MGFLIPIAVIALVFAAVWFVGQPLRRGTAQRSLEMAEGRRADLRAARDAKYGEIRDTEMDYRTGKLSEADWRAADRDLRAEAVEILHELDSLGESEPTAAQTPGDDDPVSPETPEIATIADR
jgi:hypothetical protein